MERMLAMMQTIAALVLALSRHECRSAYRAFEDAFATSSASVHRMLARLQYYKTACERAGAVDGGDWAALEARIVRAIEAK